MATSPTGFLSRDEILGGLGGRRATTLLFAIEGRTAQQVSRSRRAMATYLTEKTAAENERAFLDALAGRRDLPLRPRIQDLERYAEDWAALVPHDPALRAAVVELLRKAYAIPRDRVPRLRAALGLDDPAVATAYLKATGAPIDRTFTSSLDRRERLRWWRARLAERLESLPPATTAYSLTLTETVGAGILALPIALVGVGPIAGVGLLVVFGVVNVVTIAALVEAITRNAAMRHSSAYFGRLVGDYLGRPGTLVLSPALVITDAVALIALFVGFGTTLAGGTGVLAAAFAAGLFAAVLLIVRRNSLDATVASAIVIGAANVALLVGIAALALGHLRVENLAVPSLAPAGAGAGSALGLIFGVVLLAYFGHTSAGSAARVVLQRDPTGRALLVGNVAAMATVIALYALVVIAIGGAVPATELVGYAGTALTPLGSVVGPAVAVLGGLYALLAMGIGTIYMALSVVNQAAERLPRGLAGRTRGLVLAAPIVVLFVIAELMLLTDRASFTEPFAFLGALTTPLLGGVFPLLMIAAARRRSDYVPGRTVGMLGHPVVVAGVVLLYLAAVIVQGIVIAPDLLQQITGIAVAILIVAVVALSYRGGAFRSQVLVDVRRDVGRGGRGTFSIVRNGKLAAAPVRMESRGDVRSLEAATGEIARVDDLSAVTVDLAGLDADELKVWVHEVSGTGESAALATAPSVAIGTVAQALDPVSGVSVAPMPPRERLLRIGFGSRLTADASLEGGIRAVVDLTQSPVPRPASEGVQG